MFFSFNCLAVVCNFDSSLCGFVQDTNDKFDWTRLKGSTSSSSTGPSADHTTGTGMQNVSLIASPTCFICDQPFKRRPVVVYLAEVSQLNIFLTISANGSHNILPNSVEIQCFQVVWFKTCLIGDIQADYQFKKLVCFRLKH